MKKKRRFAPHLIYRIEVLQEVDGCYFATWETAGESGCGRYSPTVVGALAELCATLLKVDEEKFRA